MMNEEDQIAETPEGAGDNGNAEATTGAGAPDKLAAMEAELAEARAAVLYAHADIQNIRRRAEKEKEDARAYAAGEFARDILSVADNLTRALSAIPADVRSDEKLKGLVTGLEATGRELESVFARHGISRIVAMGEMLDPNRHQAMMEVPSADAAPGTIVQEIQPGYMIRDRLLRPTLVGVAKKPDA